MFARIVGRLLVALSLAASGAFAQTKINLGTQAIGGINLGTALITSNGTGALTGYTGTSCTNQFPRSLSAVGAATCATVANTDLANSSLTYNGLTVALGSSGTLSLASSNFVNQGTTTTLLHGNAAGNPSWAQASLTADVSGILPTANGGTGIAFFTAAGPSVARVYTFPDQAATILYSGGALGTPSSGTLTNATGLPLSGLATQATNTIVGNATSGTASPTALAIGSCSTASSALQWTTDTGFGCNTSITAATTTGNAGTVTVGDAGGDTTTWVLLGTSQTGSLSPATDAGLTYDANANNLTATTFTGALAGNATTATSATSATNATNIGVTDAASDTTTWLLLAGSQTGTQGALSDGGLTYNSNTNALTASTFVGALTGNADTVTTNANLTGVITSVGNATSIAAQTGTGTTFVVDTSPTIVTPLVNTITSAGTTATVYNTTATTVNAFGAATTLRMGASGGAAALGGATVNYEQLRTAGTFTSGGGSTSGSMFSLDTALVGASGDTSYLTGYNYNGAITTQGASETIAVVASMRLGEPAITKGSGDTITLASTLHIANAPTEGTTNAALSISSGASLLGGNVRVGSTVAPTVALDVTGAGIFSTTLTVTGLGSDAGQTDNTVCVDTTSGLFYKGSGALGVCLGTSSERYKTRIAPLAAGLSDVLALQPVSYYPDAKHGDPTKRLYGFTAEQAGAVLPDLMGKDAQGRPNTFDYMGVVPVLVKAIQQQQEQIEELRARITELQGLKFVRAF